MKLNKRLYNSKVGKKVYKNYLGAWTTATFNRPIGTNVFERDWDLLVVLDTCRPDALSEIKEGYKFIDEINSIISVGSSSNEWIANTFRREYINKIGKTAYIAGNAYADRVIREKLYPELDTGDKEKVRAIIDTSIIADVGGFQLLDEGWRYESEKMWGHADPQIMTDRAISIGRDEDPDRIIVHYTQPHAPYISTALNEKRELKNYEKTPFDYLRSGGDKQVVWNSYLSDLKFILEFVGTLIDNYNGKAIVTADHGEAFGEYGIYGHLPGMIHPKVRKVPWIEIDATDEKTHLPNSYEKAETRDAKDQLKALGYI